MSEDAKPIFKCSCGSLLFWRTYRAAGAWTQLVESKETGFEIVDTNLDGLRSHREPKTIQCNDCKKRVPNPNYQP